MDTNVIILSDEFLRHVRDALLEYKAKFANPVLSDIEAQLKLAEEKTADFVNLVGIHMARHSQKTDDQRKLAAYEEHLKAEAAKTEEAAKVLPA